MKNRQKTRDASPAPKPRRVSPWTAPAIIAALVLIFYWAPLTSTAATIQWDAADLHYPFQKYFSDQIRSGSLPVWTPYLASGFPFLAYPETGAWYPPHWPFFLVGITPRTIQAELALNAFLACFGAFLLISRFVGSRTAAVLGGLCYGLSGFFAGHASHVSIFAAAACFPWLLLAFRNAIDRNALRYTAAGGAVGGAMILAGYIQTAMYGFLALGVYALADLYRAPRRWLHVVSIVGGMLAIAIMLAAILIFPALELTQTSHRAGADYASPNEGTLELRTLPTLVSPDWLGAISGPYSGPHDVTQYYFYAGFLLLPLAAAGLASSKARLWGLILIVPAAWFMFGPDAGLYRAAMLLPGMDKVRAPIQGWFIVALGLAMLAAAGLDWIERRLSLPYLGAIALAILFIDLLYWNSHQNPLAYGRSTYASVYGAGEDALRRQVVPAVPPLTRFDGVGVRLGPLDGALNVGLENTYLYGALQNRDYIRYLRTMKENPKLRDGLNVGAFVTGQTVTLNASVLPRVYFPRSVLEVRDPKEAVHLLKTLDPHERSITLGPHSPVRQDPAATAELVSHDVRRYRIRYHAASPSLLRLSVPRYPGWRATLDGRRLPIVSVDLALMGVVVPAGTGEVRFEYRSNAFLLGAATSFAGAIAAGLLFAAPAIVRRRKEAFHAVCRE